MKCMEFKKYTFVFVSRSINVVNANFSLRNFT